MAVIIVTSLLLVLIPLPEDLIVPMITFYAMALPLYLLLTWRRILVQVRSGHFPYTWLERLLNLALFLTLAYSGALLTIRALQNDEPHVSVHASTSKFLASLHLEESAQVLGKYLKTLL
jgi:hypothetical protein